MLTELTRINRTDTNEFAPKPAYRNPTCVLSTHWDLEEEGKGVSKWDEEEADVCSLDLLTSAEEYPDDEYLDMSKSSSLKQTNKTYVCSFVCVFISVECN